MASDVTSELQKLVSLQGIDTHLHEIIEKLNCIPQKRADVSAEVNALTEEMESLTTRKAAAEGERRDLEAQVADATERLKQFESKLHTIKTNKEYQAAIKEVSEFKRANKEREDRILKLMEEIDAGSQKLTQLSTQLADKNAEVADALKALDQEAEQLGAEETTLKIQIQQLEVQLAPEVLRPYRQVRTRYTDAMASVEGGNCGGCRMRIPHQLLNDIQRAARLYQCPSCHRLLYAAEKTTQQG